MQKYAALMGYSVTYVNLLQRFNAWSVLLVTYWFRQVDEEIASAVLTAWLRHTDFLSPKFCFLSLTSDRVSLAEKKRLASAILSKLALSVCYLHQQDLSSQSLPPQNFTNLRRRSGRTYLLCFSMPPKVSSMMILRNGPRTPVTNASWDL